LRAGAAESAKLMAVRLGNLEQTLHKERLLPEVAGSTEVNLVMNALAGGPATRPPNPPDSEFRRFAEARTEAEAEKVWNNLLAADDRAWSQAKVSLGDAADQYDRAIRQAGMIGRALATRDRALADLPDYSRWLVHRPLDDLRDDLAGLVETLWTQTHHLAAL